MVFRRDTQGAVNNTLWSPGMVKEQTGSSRGSWRWLKGTGQDCVLRFLIAHISKDLKQRWNAEGSVFRAPDLGLIDGQLNLVYAAFGIVGAALMQNTN